MEMFPDFIPCPIAWRNQEPGARARKKHFQIINVLFSFLICMVGIQTYGIECPFVMNNVKCSDIVAGIVVVAVEFPSWCVQEVSLLLSKNKYKF